MNLRVLSFLACLLAAPALSAAPLTQKDVDAVLRQNNYVKAEALLTQMLHDAEARDPASIETSDVLFNFAWFHANLSRFQSAENLFQRCLAIRQNKLGPSHPHCALVLNGLAVLEDNQGHSIEAEKYYLQALTIQQNTLASDSLEIATTLQNLGTLYWNRSDYRQASRCLNQALDIREKKLGPEAIKTTTTLNNLALLERSLGNYPGAETLFRRVLAVREKKLGPDHPLTLTTVNHLGLTLADQTRYAEAVTWLQRAAEGQSSQIGEEQADTARSWFQLAWVYDLMGRYELAAPMHQRALAVREKILGPQHPDTAGSYAFLARHFHLQGQLDRALPLYEKALRGLEATTQASSSDRLAVLENNGLALREAGQTEKARERAEEAMTLREELLRNLFDFATEEQRLAFLRTLKPYTLFAALKDASGLARASLHCRGVILDSLLEEARLARRNDSPEQRALYDRWQKLRATPGAPQREALRLQAGLCEAAGLQIQSRRALRVDASDIQSALPPESAVIEYVVYDSAQDKLQTRPACGALIYRAGQEPVWVDLGPLAPIEQAIDSFQRAMRHRIKDAELKSILQTLTALVWTPVQTQLGPGTSRLWISPDGPLNRLAWEILPEPGDHWLGETHLISYVSSARDLLQQPLWDSRPDAITLVANPTFGPAAISSLVPLPGTHEEIQGIASLAASCNIPVHCLEGADATEEKLQSLQPGGVVHFATHGLYIAESEHPRTRAWRPGQRALLALSGAGANGAAWKSDTATASPNDGWWTAEEIAALDWDNVRLVVLSGCETGLGTRAEGEGLLGLNRAFRLAGVPRVLHSLWPVADEPTSTFMRSFYEAMLGGASPEKALQSVRWRCFQENNTASGLYPAVRRAGAFVLTQ